MRYSSLVSAIGTLALLAAARSAHAAPQDVEVPLELGPRVVPDSETRTGFTPLQVSLFAPASAVFFMGRRLDVYGLDVSVAYERVRNMYGIAISGGYLDIERDAFGFQFALAAHTERDFGGIQVGAFYAREDGDGFGIQVGGLKAVQAGYRSGGIQIAGLKTEALSDFTGLQFAALVNEASGRSWGGIQLGLINWNETETSSGFRGGFINSNKGDFAGISAGFANASFTSAPRDGARFPVHGDMTGLEAGVANMHFDGWVKGVQIGLVNWAGTLTGVQIGLVNIVSNKGALPFMIGINPGFAGSRGK